MSHARSATRGAIGRAATLALVMALVLLLAAPAFGDPQSRLRVTAPQAATNAAATPSDTGGSNWGWFAAGGVVLLAGLVGTSYVIVRHRRAHPASIRPAH